MVVASIGALLIWLNLYDYQTAGQSTIFRTNRITHQTHVNFADQGWQKIEEDSPETGKPKISENNQFLKEFEANEAKG